jgi:hypothetical protein
MYKHTCACGGDLYLIGFTGSCYIPISEDGFYLGDGSCDTDDEVVQCSTCYKTGPLEFTDGED